MFSLGAAIVASAVALRIVNRKAMGPLQAVLGSLMMGAGIPSMHYISMAAMRLAAECRYDVRLVAEDRLIRQAILTGTEILTFEQNEVPGFIGTAGLARY
jgi:NO-binding membrane sensor protein with MHYT domain